MKVRIFPLDEMKLWHVASFSLITHIQRGKAAPEMQLCITLLCMTCPHLPSFPFLSPLS